VPIPLVCRSNRTTQRTVRCGPKTVARRPCPGAGRLGEPRRPGRRRGGPQGRERVVKARLSILLAVLASSPASSAPNRPTRHGPGPPSSTICPTGTLVVHDKKLGSVRADPRAPGGGPPRPGGGEPEWIPVPVTGPERAELRRRPGAAATEVGGLDDRQRSRLVRGDIAPSQRPAGLAGPDPVGRAPRCGPPFVTSRLSGPPRPPLWRSMTCGWATSSGSRPGWHAGRFGRSGPGRPRLLPGR